MTDPQDDFRTDAVPLDEEAAGLPETVPVPEDQDDGDDSIEDGDEPEMGGEGGHD